MDWSLNGSGAWQSKLCGFERVMDSRERCRPTENVEHLHTPDGRYIVVRGRLWRASNPCLAEQDRQAAVHQLMTARIALRRKNDPAERAHLKSAVDAAKRKLGERGPVWWSDGAPDLNRHLVKNTPYAEWFAALDRSAAGSE